MLEPGCASDGAVEVIPKSKSACGNAVSECSLVWRFLCPEVVRVHGDVRDLLTVGGMLLVMALGEFQSQDYMHPIFGSSVVGLSHVRDVAPRSFSWYSCDDIRLHFWEHLEGGQYSFVH